MSHPIRRGFTLIELLVALGIIAVLLAIILPGMERVRHKGYIAACASNLRQLGQGITMYEQDNHGALPRTTYVAGAAVVAGTGTNSADPFAASGPKPNDVTAALWLLARVQKLPTSMFICPYNDVNEFEADRAAIATQSNFTDYKRNLGYSYNNPYPDPAVAHDTTTRQPGKLSAELALMADLNPGVSDIRKADPFRAVPHASAREMAWGNSPNHEREGQNVLFGDGHVTYESTPLCGVYGDNIYTGQAAARPTIVASPVSRDDSVLLPTN